MSGFGAGNLGSYMGGGGDYESPTQSTYSGNMSTIFLLLAAGVVLMFMVSNLALGPGGPGGTNRDPNNNITNEDTTNNGDPNNPTDNPYEATSLLEGIDLSKYDIDPETYEEQKSLSELDLFDSFSDMQAWKVCGDSDLVLKLLERYTLYKTEIYEDDDY